MNTNRKAATHCFIDKSLLKCLVDNDKVNNVYLMTSLIYVTLLVVAISSRYFFGLTISLAQQRLKKKNNEFARMLYGRDVTLGHIGTGVAISARGLIWLPQCQYDLEAHLDHIITCMYYTV